MVFNLDMEYYHICYPEGHLRFPRQFLENNKFIKNSIFDTKFQPTNNIFELFFCFEKKIILYLINYFREGKFNINILNISELEKTNLISLLNYISKNNLFLKDAADQIKFGQIDLFGNIINTGYLSFNNYPLICANNPDKKYKILIKILIIKKLNLKLGSIFDFEKYEIKTRLNYPQNNIEIRILEINSKKIIIDFDNFIQEIILDLELKLKIINSPDDLYDL